MTEQIDREAAAAWAKSNSRHQQAANILRGSCDNAPIVQAFASHREDVEAQITTWLRAYADEDRYGPRWRPLHYAAAVIERGDHTENDRD